MLVNKLAKKKIIKKIIHTVSMAINKIKINKLISYTPYKFIK